MRDGRREEESCEKETLPEGAIEGKVKGQQASEQYAAL